MENLMERMVHNLKRIRKERKIPYSVVERATGIKASRLQEAENGDVRLSVGELEKLLSFYRLTPQQVLRKRNNYFVKIAVPVAAVLVFGVIIFSQIFGQEPDREASDIPVVTDHHDGVDQDDQFALDNLPDSDRQADPQNEPGPASPHENNDQQDPDSNHDAKGHKDEASPVVDQGSGNGDGNGSTATDETVDSDHDLVDHSGGDSGKDATDDAAIGTGEEEIAIDYGSVHPGTRVTVPALPSPQYKEPVVFRMWGNIPYNAGQIPELEHNDEIDVKHVIPLAHLTVDRPDWLDEAHKDKYILNLATADIWTDTAIEEWIRLRNDGFPAIGFGRRAEAYEPYIVQVKDRKIGFVSLAGLIHEFQHIAQMNWIGLPRAYDNQEVITAVQRARAEVDDLIVLLHIGQHRSPELLEKQERLARVAAEAGADLVIGNRSLFSQDVATIEDTPVFYSLGRSISEDARNGLVSYVIDVHYNDGIDKIVLHVGSMRDGVIRFGERSLDEGVQHDGAPDFSALKAWSDKSGIPLEIIYYNSGE